MPAANRQSGVVLILVLVFMLVLSVAGVAAMQLANLEQRLGGNMSQRSRSVQGVEAALSNIENDLKQTSFEINAVGNLCETGTSTCFTSQCPQGRCFDGSYTAAVNASDTDQCSVLARSAQNELFQDPARWTNSSQNQQVDIEFAAGDDSVPVYGLIEWRCFMPIDNADPDANITHQFQPSHWQPLFRITAYTPGRSGQARVMLQSFYSPAAGRFGWREIAVRFAS